MGTPNELTDDKGEVVWLADYEAYGNTAKVVYTAIELKYNSISVSSEELQPLRFQGQSFDVETGLHYNRFRYFDPDLGMFITRDPIGLMGGSNVFQYAPNPTGWIDPFGLFKAPAQLPNTPGVYIITNGNNSYVGSSGYGKQGMNQRVSTSTHTEAQKLLKANGNTKVQFKRVNFGTKINLSASDKNNILRYYENIEYQKQAKKFNMTNTASIQSADKVGKVEKLIKDSGTTTNKRRVSCKK